MVAKLKPDKQKTIVSRFGVPLFLLFWICAIIFGAMELFNTSKHSHQIRGGGTVDERMSDTEAGSLGGEREAMLVEATRDYVKGHPDAPAAMAQGKELAPVDWLNDRLSEKNAHFRVRQVDGLKAEMYDVS